MNTPRLLILGGSHAEVPLINAGKELGFEVITTGNKASDVGHSFSDLYVPGDFSNVEEMIALAREHRVTAVCSGCNDFAAISAASIAEALGLSGHDSVDLTYAIHHKNRFYDMANKATVPVPRSTEVTTISEARESVAEFGLPIILKPTDLTGGKGISVVHHLEELDAAWKAAASISRRDCFVLQQFIVGSNHAVSVLVVNGEVNFVFFDNEHYFINKYLVGAASFPTSLSKEIQSRVLSSVQLLVDDLHLADGLLHLQFMVNEKGEHFFIDVCRRPPGDLYISFVELATNVPYPELIVRLAAGLEAKIPDKQLSGKFIGRLCLMPTRIGRFAKVQEVPGPGRVIERTPLMLPGTEISDLGVQKVEILQLEFDSAEEMIRVMNTPSIQFQVEVI
jgi:biotin carboxylase